MPYLLQLVCSKRFAVGPQHTTQEFLQSEHLCYLPEWSRDVQKGMELFEMPSHRYLPSFFWWVSNS